MTPLLWLSLALVGGVLLAAGLHLPLWVWAGLCGGGVILVGLGRRLRRPAHLPLPLGILLMALALGGLRWQIAQPIWSPADLAWQHLSRNAPADVCLRGVVEAAPDARSTEMRLQLRADERQDAVEGWVRVRGQLLIVTTPGEWRYGDRLLVCGSLNAPDSNARFSYRDYLARQGVYSISYYPRLSLLERHAGNPLLAALYALQQRAAQTLEQLFPQPEAALLSGILLGLENEIPPSLEDAFRATGTAHIVAISGFNMTLLAGLFISFFSRLTRRGWAALLAGLALLFYTLLVGGSAGVVRAAIMACLGLFGHLLGRRQSGPTSLSFTAALMTLINPQLPWDVSFQLSFMATLGLVLYAEPLQQGFVGLLERRLAQRLARQIAGPVGEYGLFTLAAQITTLPVTVYHFQHLSLSTLLANPLILPVQPLVMILGGLALLGGLVWLPLGQVLALPALLPVTYTIRVVEWLGQLPGGDWALGEIPLWLAVAFYLLLLGLSLPALRRRLGGAAGVAAVLLLAGFSLRAALAAPNGELRLMVMAQEGQPIVLLRSPSGRALLLNAAVEAPPLRAVLGQALPPLNPGLDGILVTAPQRATLDGLSDLLETNPSPVIWLAGAPPSGRSLARLQALCLEQHTTLERLSPGQVLQVEANLRLHLLARSNQRAAVLLEYERLHLLLPGGLSPETIARQAGELPGGSLLLLGSEDLPAAAAWQALEPQLVLLAAPAPEGNLPRGWVWVAPGQRLLLTSNGATLRLAAGD